MLTTLSIRNVVLVDRLDLDFRPGLCALTGETGAGKSILLDALGLALGARAEARLVRHGAEQATVAATFELADAAPLRALLAEHGLKSGDDVLTVRRVLGIDGRSRAFVDDQPVGVALLRRIGEQLVEIHGQLESQRLLETATHRGSPRQRGRVRPGATRARPAQRPKPSWRRRAATRTTCVTPWASWKRSRRGPARKRSSPIAERC